MALHEWFSRKAVLGRITMFLSVITPATLVAFVAGVLAWGAFNWGLEVTNRQAFCISCHEMRDNVYREYTTKGHYSNRTGVRATCPDCHVPREWLPKVVRKIRASNELVHWLLGSISTKEKFEKKRGALAVHVWRSMRASDSHECRNCHDDAAMNERVQKPLATGMHSLGSGWDMTCIDCHKGIVHSLPAGISGNAWLEPIHDRIEKEKVQCHLCHKNLTRPAKGDDWSN